MSTELNRQDIDACIAQAWAAPGPMPSREQIAKELAKGLDLLREHELIDARGNWQRGKSYRLSNET